MAGYPGGFVHAWTTGGSRFLSYDTGQGAVQASPTLVDLNGDGVLDILTGNTAGYVRGFTGQGATIFALRDSCQPICGIFGTPTAADLDRDGDLEVREVLVLDGIGHRGAWARPSDVRRQALVRTYDRCRRDGTRSLEGDGGGLVLNADA